MHDTNSCDIFLTTAFQEMCFCAQVDCYDHHVSGSHRLIGSFKATLAEMQTATHVSPVSTF